EGIVRRCHSLAARGLVALLREELVGDTHLDVVGLACEHQQRLVLRLPAEAGDGAIVAAGVGHAADDAVGVTSYTLRLPGGRAGRVAGANGRVVNVFDEARTHRWRRNAENDVGVATLSGHWVAGRCEHRLCDAAAAGIAAAGDGEHGMNAAIGYAVHGLEA